MVAQTQDQEARIEQQMERLRNYLAYAWQAGMPPARIHRLETMIQQRWALLDRVQKHDPLLQPG